MINKQMTKIYTINGNSLTVAKMVETSLDADIKIIIDKQALDRMQESRKILDELLVKKETIYGVNTNMGGMVKWLVPESKAEALQNNLIRSVASNVGKPFPTEIVRAAMLCRINSLACGNSAISMDVFELLVDAYNLGVVPYVPMLGSLGTSGDLGPLAAIALVLAGSGKAWVKGELMSGKEALAAVGLNPATLSYKDGLSLINGTSFMTAVLGHAIYKSKNMLKNYLSISALTFGCLNAKKKPMSPSVHQLKKHEEQLEIADELYELMGKMEGVVDDAVVSNQLSNERSTDAVEGSDAVEDPYSVRCTPQILGPVKSTIDWVEQCIEKEINSSSDNPLINLDERKVYHCGHFHGQYIAMSADFLKIALTTMANLSDRRIDRLLDRKKNGVLPAFLAVEKAGMRLGLMGSQFMSTSLTAEMRSNSHPTSIQSLPSTADFQDTVSMGLIAAREALELTEKCAYVVGTELFLGFQALDLMKYNKMPKPIKALYNEFRAKHPFMDADRSVTDELEYAKELVWN